MNDIIYVYITNPNKEEAALVARHLLKKHLIACANMFPISSLYWWEGEIEEGNEVVLIAKTTAEQYDAVKREVEEIHPYEVPCIVQIPAQANAPYYEWLIGSMKE